MNADLIKADLRRLLKSEKCAADTNPANSRQNYTQHKFLPDKRVYLFKGDNQARSKLISKTFPDNTGRSNRRAEARGDVPLYLLQTNALKDRINNALLRNTAGPNYVHFPDWIGEWFYDELTYEERGPDGKWKKPGRGANEAFDLMVYAHALVILRGYKKIKWEKPPPWAYPFEMTETSIPSPKSVPLTTSERITEQKETAAPESKPSAWAPINSSGGWL